MAKTKTTSSSSSSSRIQARADLRIKTCEGVVQSWLQLAQLRAEKCELKEAEAAFTMALQAARRNQDLRGMMEAIAGLLRLASEALDEAGILKWDRELDSLVAAYPKQISPLVWYCKSGVARHRKEPLLAQRLAHRYLKAIKKEVTSHRAPMLEIREVEEAMAKGWLIIANSQWQRGRVNRAARLAEIILSRNENLEGGKIRSIDGLCYLLLGNIAEKQRRYDDAMSWFQKAHGSFLGEHNWYYHLYVLYGYARLNRYKQNYSQAYWHLDLIEKAASGPEFGFLRREIVAERIRLQQDAIDLLIDSRQCLIKTREGGQVSLRKQYVLLHILEALSQAHDRDGSDRERGLSKSEIIKQVWNETYRPEAHDNKLYYNINRLRKLIEPDIKKPQYLLNCKEGYRLAPGLRIQFVGERAATSKELNRLAVRA